MNVEEQMAVDLPLLPPLLTEEEHQLPDVTADSLLDIPQKTPPPHADKPPESLPLLLQVSFKTIEGKLWLFLPADKELKAADGSAIPETSWSDVLEQLGQRLVAGDRFWQSGTPVYLQGGDRLLDTRQLQELAEALSTYDLLLSSIVTQRRQTAIAAATAGFSVEQGQARELLPDLTKTAFDDPLYVKMTVRSGTEIRHAGSVIVFGDVNAGGEILADGDILVWGKLKGKAHAGIKGNCQAVIMALHLEATQLRIGDFIARVDTPSTFFCPEVAYISTSGSPSICIVSASDFASGKYS